MVNLINVFNKGTELGFNVSYKVGVGITLIKKNKLTTSYIEVKEGNVRFNILIRKSISNQKELDKIQIDYNNVKRDANILAELIANK